MARVRDPYAALADLYDRMAADPEIANLYSEWHERVLAAVAQRGLDVRVLVDVACGTGNSTVPWTHGHDWDVIGVDRSEAMLRRARRKSQRVRWIRQDLTTFRLAERADVVTCHFDAVNHLLTLAQLQRAFTNVGRRLRKGGLFQFDVNTEYWLRWLSLHEKLFRVGPHYFVATNAYDASRRTATFTQVWFVKAGRYYRRRLVAVRERAYSQRDIRQALRTAGFKLLSVTAQRRFEGKAIRLLYLAEKT
jgi:SAM-dependent methyltransferase